MNGARLTAQFGKILTVLHIIDEAAPWVEGDGATNGTTKCGIPMLTAENWLFLEQMPGEQICGRCLNPGSAEPPQEQPLF